MVCACVCHGVSVGIVAVMPKERGALEMESMWSESDCESPAPSVSSGT